MKSFLFYDIETTGLHCAFDQILTFAAIRTDLSLKELERISVVVRLRPDVVPSPGAFITHRLSLESLKGGCTEYEAARRIHQLVNTPGTVSLGYNTLGFDDDFLRFTFYRNLLDPYTHQYAGGCSRMDILPIALLYRVFNPMDISWPAHNGRPSMKLEQISDANALVSSGRAHDAMVDVEATLALARRLFSDRKMWSYCLGFFDKKIEGGRLDRLGRHAVGGEKTFPMGIMLSLVFGADNLYMGAVLGIGESLVYGNQTLWLRLDQQDFSECQEGLDDYDKLFVVRKKRGESPVVLPALDRFWDRLSLERRQVVLKNLDFISHHLSWFEQAVQWHRNYAYPDVPDVDPDAALYQSGFFSAVEKKEMAIFHRSSAADKNAAVQRIRRPRIQALASRIIFRNFHGEESVSIDGDGKKMPAFDAGRYMERIRTGNPPLRGYRNDVRYDVEKARDEVRTFLHGDGDPEIHLDDEQRDILHALLRYIDTI